MLGGEEDAPLLRAVKKTLITEYFQLVRRSIPDTRGDSPSVPSNTRRPVGAKSHPITKYFTGTKTKMREGEADIEADPGLPTPPPKTPLPSPTKAQSPKIPQVSQQERLRLNKLGPYYSVIATTTVLTLMPKLPCLKPLC